MPLTRDFRETVLKNLRDRPGYRDAMLAGAVEEFLAGDLDVAKDVLRDLINGTMGFDALSRRVGLPAKSLMRMFGPNGNPQAKNLFAVIAALQEEAGIWLKVSAAVQHRRTSRKRTLQASRGEPAANLGFAEKPPRRWRGKAK